MKGTFVVSEPRYPYVHVDVVPNRAEELGAALFELGALGVEERDDTTLVRSTNADVITLVASFADDASAQRALAALRGSDGRDVGIRDVRLEWVVGDAWRDAWKAHFRPTRVGKRLVVKPSWEAYTPAPGDVVLEIDPGRAFGTGTHESTRLVLAEIDRRVRGGERVLDVGAGSGILAVAAVLLGADRAVCVDEDADTVDVVRETAARNRVASRIRASAAPVQRVRGTFELVLANIEARVLVPLAAPIAARVGPEGTLVLSGILAGQEDTVARTYAPMVVEDAPRLGEWVALVLRHPRKRSRMR
jgi:ribosomal protein L11 methyltransferase